ncbi:MAG: 4Fe-4S single cluster domain-containing protein [Gloeomargarita sp. SKYBB_i_bin120]|nr:radical SAM protein [Gloeomargarita sp. SKYB120]MDW8177358.1 4Fe-4S single cluster domain-containing protein [Gloeomargarita sp. SKYBB_i_bin120]
MEIPAGYVNLMGRVHGSEVNGPGRRAVVWVQGCYRACPGCFNPQSWAWEIRELVPVPELVDWILADPDDEGVTFSGGEPFLQAVALAQVARAVKAAGRNVMSFSGYTLAELQSPQAPPGAADLLSQLDILVDGPYVASLAVNDPHSLVSSRNQRVHVFNPALQNRLDWASNQAEVHVLKDGTRIFTGFLGQFVAD